MHIGCYAMNLKNLEIPSGFVEKHRLFVDDEFAVCGFYLLVFNKDFIVLC